MHAGAPAALDAPDSDRAPVDAQWHPKLSSYTARLRRRRPARQARRWAGERPCGARTCSRPSAAPRWPGLRSARGVADILSQALSAADAVRKGRKSASSRCLARRMPPERFRHGVHLPHQAPSDSVVDNLLPECPQLARCAQGRDTVFSRWTGGMQGRACAPRSSRGQFLCATEAALAIRQRGASRDSENIKRWLAPCPLFPPLPGAPARLFRRVVPAREHVWGR